MKRLSLIAIIILGLFQTGQAQSKTQILSELNNFFKTFDNGYYGYISVDQTYLYTNIKDGRRSKIPIAEISEARVEEANRVVKIYCKSGNCVTGVTGKMFPSMSYRTSIDFDANKLARDLNRLINILKGRNNVTPNNSDVLAKINSFLKTFDNGYYGYLSVDDYYLYTNIKNGGRSKIPISEMSEARVVTKNRNVRIFCKSGDCVTGVNGNMYDGMGYRTDLYDFDTDQLARDLNQLIRELQGKKSTPVAYNNPPSITISEPDQSRGFKVVRENAVRVAGRATDSDGVYQVTANGLEANLQSGGYFSINVPLAIGDNSIVIKATDTKMKSATKTITVNRKSEDVVINNNTNNVTTSEKRVALVFGNSNYTGQANLGQNPINDARGIASTLRGLGFEVIIKTDANLYTMNNAIREFGRQNKDADVAFFYFAGHGMQVEQVNYLLPVGVNIREQNDVSFESVSVNTVQKIMETSNPDRLNLIVLDACRNNPFRSWQRGGNGGLADMTPPSGTLIAFATSPGSTASNGSGHNGLYTGELIEQLKKPQRIEDVFINTRVEVEKKSGGQQSPWELARLRGKYFLVK